jgi:hypothetical protein
MPRQWLAQRRKAKEYPLTFINNRVNTLSGHDSVMTKESVIKD